MKPYENFEFMNQMLLAPLLSDTNQREFFKKTNACHERMFLDIICRIIRPEYFFEIGAYEAETARRVAERLPDSQCIAFEADPDIFAHFFAKHDSLPMPNFRYLHTAISDRNGTITFYKQTIPTSDKINIDLVPNNSVRKKPSVEGYRQVSAPVQKLDSYIRSQRFRRGTNVLRIDVESLCYEVLFGARKTLKLCQAVYAEIEDFEIWEKQRTVFDIYPFLDKYGFVPVSRDVQTPGQYNVFWIKKDMAIQRPFRSRLALYYKELAGIAAQSALAQGSSCKAI